MGKGKPNLPVSLIVPVHKTEAYLHRCIDSILEQTFQNFELILVDDGSPDGCPEICNQYARKDTRVKVIHQTNRGQTRARQTGLKKSRGRYVWFIDSDDWLEPEAVEILLEAASHSRADIITFGVFFEYSSHNVKLTQPIKTGYLAKTDLEKHIYPKMIYSGNFFFFGVYAAMWNKLFHRSVVETNLMNVHPGIKIGEDGLTTYASFLDAKKVHVLEEAHLYHYRDNHPSITRSHHADQFDNALALIKHLRQINTNKKVYDLSKQIDYYLMYNIWSIFIEEFYHKHPRKFRDRYNYLKSIIHHKDVIEPAKNISTDHMKPKFKIFFNLLKEQRTLNLVILSAVLGWYKRLNVHLRRTTGKY